MLPATERRLLQTAVALGACVPVFAGAAGMMFGPGILADGVTVSLDSHFRYLSGILCAIGITFWRLVPYIEQRTAEVRVLGFLVILGGLARLAGALFVAAPPIGGWLALGMELLVTPLLLLWQARVASSNKPK